MGRWDLNKWLRMLLRPGGLAPVANDVLVYQTDQCEWIDPATIPGVLANYLYKPGITGGQTAYGGDASGDDLHLRSTSHATKGTVFINDDGGTLRVGINSGFLVEAGVAANTLYVDSAGGGQVGIGTNAPGTNFHIYEDNADTEPALQIEQDGAGDAAIRFYLTGGVSFSMGIDNSIGDIFRIASATWIGLNYRFAINPTTGNVGIGADPVASARLEIAGTEGALLISRMSTVERNALGAVNGMILYNTTTNEFNFYENGAWVSGSGLA